jgi:LEA14-like dessication related protein
MLIGKFTSLHDHMRTKIILYFFLILFFSSCGNFAEITIGEVTGVSVKGFQDNALLVEVLLPIDNPTHHRITISDMDLRLTMNRQYVGKLQLNDKLVVASNSDMVHRVNVQVRLVNIFGAGLMMMNMKKGQKVLFQLEGTITAKSLLMKKILPVNESQEVII